MRGFIAFPSAERPRSTSLLWKAIDARWRLTEFGGFEVRHHARTRVFEARHGGVSVILFGDVFETRPPDKPRGRRGILARVLASRSKPKSRSVIEELAESSEQQLHERLRTLSGRFALIVERNGHLRVYHDGFGARSIYYLGGGAHAFGTHIELLAAAYNLRKDENALAILRAPESLSRVVQYGPGDATLYAGLNGLPPNHFLDVAARRIVRYWPMTRRSNTTFEQLLLEIDAYHARLARFLSTKEIVLGVTGGVDSRVNIAALQAKGAHLTGCTWHDGVLLSRKELPIVRKVVKAARITNVPIAVPPDDTCSTAALASFNAGRSPAESITAPMAEVYGSNPTAVFVRGYGGEIMRGFYNVSRNPMRDASPPELMRLYGSGIKRRPVSAEYERRCLPFFERWAEITDIEGTTKLGYDPNDIFYWEHRMGMWGSSMLNELDPAMNNLVGLNSRALYETSFGLPDHERLTKELFMKIVSRYNPELAQPGYC
jgi:hypothetical protein